MAVQTPPVQDGAAGANAVQQTSEAAAPLITGPAPILWGGFGAFAVIFLVVLVLIMRGRLSRPPRKNRHEKPAEDYFQPAGKGAEISFEDEPAHPARVRETAPEPKQPQHAASDEKAKSKDKSKTKSAPFSGLFSSKKRSEQTEPEVVDTRADDHVREEPPAPAAEADVTEVRRQIEAEFAEMKRRAEEEAAATRREAEENAARALQEAEETRARILQQAEDAERERLRAEEEARAAAARREEEERGEVEREAEDFERRKRAAALDERLRAVADAQSALAREAENLHEEADALRGDLARELESRFAALTEMLETRLAAGAPAAAGAGDGEDDGARAFALAELVSRRMAEQREAIDAAIAKLSDRIDAVAGAPEAVKALMNEMAALRGAASGRPVGPVSPEVQLVDIVRNALPQTAYEMRALLSNNRRADCLIRLPQPPGPIAIDASFPAEAFHRLYKDDPDSADMAQAENAFRRAVLRHIVDIAERLIVPGETAESAMMFVPSETMYTEIHTRFPDLVQDSFRARVWIVSPTSLMATLHTVRAVLRDARTRESAELIHAEAQHVLAEVDELRRRVAALEDDFEKARHDVRDLASGADQVYRRAETITNSGRAIAKEALEHGPRRIIAGREPAQDAASTDAAARAAYAEPPQEAPGDDDQPRFPLR